MASIFNKIQRLKRQPGWSWQHFLVEIDSVDPDGIKLKLLQRYYRSPNKKPTPHIIRIIDQLHNDCFPSPFPAALDRLMRVYRELKMSNRYLTKDKDIRDLENHVQRLLAAVEADDYLSHACLQWLLGNIEFDRISVHLGADERDQLGAAKQRALDHYQAVLASIEQYNRHHPPVAVGTRHIYRVQSNILACYLNAVPEQQRSQDATILYYLRESGYLAQCKQAIAAEPFQWAVARNGLRFSSLLQDVVEIEHFFTLLLKVHPRFVDLSYEPFNQLSISAMPDYHWALENVLTPEYLAERSRQLKQDKRPQAA